MEPLTSVELCAGVGGQGLGLEQAGFAAALGAAIVTALGQALCRRLSGLGHAITHDFMHSGSGGGFGQYVLQRLTDHGDAG